MNAEQKQKPLIWLELLHIALTMTPDQLQMPVIWEGDDQGGEIHSLNFSGEDLYQTDYGLVPASEVAVEDIESEMAWIKYKVGQPILGVDGEQITPENAPIKIEWNPNPIAVYQNNQLITGEDEAGHVYFATRQPISDFIVKGPNLFKSARE